MSDILLSQPVSLKGLILEELVLIPTGFKSKLPQTLSYPTGAEVLSLAFADVPQFGMFTLNFWFYSQARPTEMGSYSVLEIAYHRATKSIHSRKDDVEAGRFEPKWEITIRPVPRNRRHLIKTKLQSEALPLASTWLLENADHDEVGGLTLTFSFDEESELLSASKFSSLAPRRSK
jgi:hypothetical protein